MGSDPTAQPHHRDQSRVLDQQTHRGHYHGDRRSQPSAPLKSRHMGWDTDRAKVLSPTTVRLLVQTLRSRFNAAVQDRLIASSPAARLSLPRSENARIVPLTVAQVQALADAMLGRCRAMIIIQAGLGLRIADCWHYASKMSTSCAVLACLSLQSRVRACPLASPRAT